MNHPLSRGGNSKTFFPILKLYTICGAQVCELFLEMILGVYGMFFFSIHSLATSIVSIFNTHTNFLAGCTFKTSLPLFTCCGGDNQFNGAIKRSFWDKVAISSALNHEESTSCQILSTFALLCNIQAG